MGEYYLVAVADADANLVKGIKVTVPDLTAVYKAGEVTGNLMVSQNWSSDGTVNGMQVGTKADTGEYFALYSSTDTNVGGNVYGVSGASLPIGRGNVSPKTGLQAVAKNGDVVVFGALVAALYDTPTISATMRGAEGTDTLFPVEYGEGEGFTPVYGNGYEQFGVTFKLNDVVTASGNWHMTMRMGFVKGSTTNSMEAFTLKPGSMYVGFEYVYDLITKVTGETTFTEGQGGSFTVDGAVVNQVGSVGTLNQGITWLLMNEQKTALVDDVTISENKDGSMTVTVAENAPVGTYKLVAVADDYANIIKNIDIVVEEEVIPIEGITISATEGGITVATDTALSGAQLIFVTYEGGRMVSVDIDKKVNQDAQSTQEYPIPAGFTGAKVMLWSKDFVPLANVLN